MRTHDFHKSIKIGKDGEQIIENYLKNQPNVKDFKDVSNDPFYQDKDIDYLVTFQNGTTGTIEIKTDTYTSGNIFYETMSNVEFGVIGCMEKSQADFLFYYFTKTKELYIMRLPKYRTWFNENKNRFIKKVFKNINKKRDGTYTSEGYTIPKTYLENNFNCYKKIYL